MSYSSSYTYSPNYYSQQDKEWLLRGASASALQHGAYSERLQTDKNGDLYIRSFLINSKRNARGWAVDGSTILQNVYSIVGKPVVLDQDPRTRKADHPQWDSTRSAQANFLEQSKKAIGVVEKVWYNKENDSYYADSKITDPKAKEYINRFHGKQIPINVSPQLIYNEKTELPNYYRNWEFSHLAIVDKAAYGSQAQVIGACNGDGKTCTKKLQQVAAATAAASASASGLELKPNTSSADAFLIGSTLFAPRNGKRPGRIA